MQKNVFGRKFNKLKIVLITNTVTNRAELQLQINSGANRWNSCWWKKDDQEKGKS